MEDITLKSRVLEKLYLLQLLIKKFVTFCRHNSIKALIKRHAHFIR